MRTKPLDFYGGFEKYQEGLRQSIVDCFKKVPKKKRGNLLNEVLEFKDTIPEIYNLFKNGLEGISKNKPYIKYSDLHLLEHFLFLSGHKLSSPIPKYDFTPKEIKYFKKEMVKAGTNVRGMFKDPNEEIGPISMWLYLGAFTDSDNEIKKRQGKAV